MGTTPDMMLPKIAPSIQHSNPLMQFWGRVDGSSAYIRIQGSRLEWSRVGQEWIITMAPMTSITAVDTHVRLITSSLIVTTTVGTVEFNVETDTAEEARSLLVRLIASSAASSTSDVATVGDTALINLTWKPDSDVDNDLAFEPEWARILEG